MAFSDPKKNLEHLHFPASGTVADFGAGSGHYAFLLAERLAPHHGKVIAIDVQRDLLEKLKAEAIRRNLDNVTTAWGDAEEMRGTGLADACADAALISNILFQLSEKDVFVQEVARILRPHGELLVIDWTDSFAGMGPSPDLVVVAEKAQKLFERHGFTPTEAFDAGDHHWGLVFRKS